MSDRYQPGELFVYTNGDRWELGMVKRPNNSGDGYFCWYSRGDTAANTPRRCMHKLSNAGFTHIEQMLDDEKPLNVPDEITVLIGLFCKDYAQCLVDATLHDKRPFDEVDHRTCGSMAAVEAKLIRELAEDIAKVGVGTCHLEECEHEREIPHDLPDCDGGWYTEVTHDCDECGYENTDPNIRFCGGCGRRVVSE